MSTRSTVHIHDEHGEHLGAIYRQHAGQPTGMGQDIVDTLKDALDSGFQFHDISELGLYLFSMLRSGNVHGQICLTTADDKDQYDYTYCLSTDHRKDSEDPFLQSAEIVVLTVTGFRGEELYTGPLADFNPKEVEAVRA